jgi:hypothetical protein
VNGKPALQVDATRAGKRKRREVRRTVRGCRFSGAGVMRLVSVKEACPSFLLSQLGFHSAARFTERLAPLGFRPRTSASPTWPAMTGRPSKNSPTRWAWQERGQTGACKHGPRT